MASTNTAQKRHKVKVIVVSGRALETRTTYVNVALWDVKSDCVWRNYQAKTPFGDGPEPVWKKAIVFGVPRSLDFELRLDVYDAKTKQRTGGVRLTKSEGLAGVRAYTEAEGRPSEGWSKWHSIGDSGGRGQLHVALIPHTIKTQAADLTPPAQPLSSPATTEDPQTQPASSASAAPAGSADLSSPGENQALAAQAAAPASTLGGAAEKPWTEKRMDKARRKRVHVRQEITDSEQSYCASLRELSKVYIEPLLAELESRGLAQHLKLFTDVVGISEFHQLFLGLLKRTADVGATFMKYADYLKIYSSYINGYPHTLEVLSELRQNALGKLFKSLRKGAKMEITSYLIMPVQRIPRYVLLLKELKKYTWPDHPEFPNLVRALSKAQEIATHVNEKIREIENMQKILDIQVKIEGDFEHLVKPSRKLIREDTLTKVSSNFFGTIKNKKRIIILFSDLLMWTSPSYQFKGNMSLAAARLEDMPGDPLGIVLSSSKSLVKLVFTSSAQKEGWKSDFAQGQAENRKIRTRLRERKGRTRDRQAKHAHTLIMSKFRTLERKNAKEDTKEGQDSAATEATPPDRGSG